MDKQELKDMACDMIDKGEFNPIMIRGVKEVPPEPPYEWRRFCSSEETVTLIFNKNCSERFQEFIKSEVESLIESAGTFTDKRESVEYGKSK